MLINDTLAEEKGEDEEDLVSIYGGDSEPDDPEQYAPSPKKKKHAREYNLTEDQIQRALKYYRSGSGGTRKVEDMQKRGGFSWIHSRSDIDNILLRYFYLI